MSLLSIVWLAVGLAMDAAAASAARAVGIQHLKLADVSRVALYFGGAQALMPLLGWALGATIGPYVQGWADWIAFALLSVLGLKLLWEAFHPDLERASEPGDRFAHRELRLLAVATSLDAFAVGVTLPMLRAPLLLTVTTIGLVTALLSVAGLALGHRLGHMLGSRFDVVGGLCLIALGFKILLD